VGELAITVVGEDRPGIIADVTDILATLRLNLIEASTTLLRGYFTMTLVCSGEASVRVTEASLRSLPGDRSLLAAVREVSADATTESGTPYTLTVHGADRLAIVAAVTRAIAVAGGNITDLAMRLSGVLYLLSAEVDLPSTVDEEALAEQLDTVAEDLHVEVSLRPSAADVL
jgi:glycine cleavage system transcriptional repressor